MGDNPFNILEELDSLAKEESSDSPAEENPTSIDDNLNTLRTTNWEILNYFRSAYISQSEQTQALKSELFELDVKIEELQKTKDIYSFQSDISRNIFSPLPASATQGKGQLIQSQLDELQDVRVSLTAKIQNLDTSLTTIRNHIQALESSNQCLSSLYQMIPQSQPEQNKPEETESLDNGITFIADSSEYNTASHASQILMLNQYDKSQIAERIRTSIRQGIENHQNKLEVLKWLIQSDPTRARLTIQELQDSNNRLLHATDSIILELDKDLNYQHPVWMCIDECIHQYRTLYPECTIDASVDCADYDMKLQPIITITLLQLLQEVLNNTFCYSKASKVALKVYINNHTIDVYIHDNGVGINPDYLSTSPWHSGLHRLHEIIHLLDGRLQIDGDLMGGTTVRFSFPVLLSDI